MAIAGGWKPPPYWLITRRTGGRLEVLTTGAACGEEQAMVVFGFEEEARMFVHIAAPEGDWRARETSAGEIVSLLNSPYAGVKRVALDPVPGFGATRTYAPFGTREFISSLRATGDGAARGGRRLVRSRAWGTGTG